jgi:hypothetical protein
VNSEDRESGPVPGTAFPTSPHHKKQVNCDLSGLIPSGSDSAAVSSQQVAWWEVHSYVAPLLEAVGSWPTVGTPAWCDLVDDDPRKLAALLDASRHWALRVETCQTAQIQASHAISAAADWSAIAYRFLGRAQFYAERPWLKRKVS